MPVMAYRQQTINWFGNKTFILLDVGLGSLD